MSGLLSAIPPYFSQDVITADRRVATLAFGIRLMGLDQQQRADRSDALEPAPARGRERAARGPAGAGGAVGRAGGVDPWRRLETLLAGLAAVALVLLIAFRGDRRRALVPLAPIVAGDRLVGADPVRGAGAAEPDVGHARGARDRDLHRVQRAAVRAPPPGAARRPRHDARRCAAATAARAPRWRPRGSPRSPASACWRCRTSGCCATSAW